MQWLYLLGNKWPWSFFDPQSSFLRRGYSHVQHKSADWPLTGLHFGTVRRPIMCIMGISMANSPIPGLHTPFTIYWTIHTFNSDLHSFNCVSMWNHVTMRHPQWLDLSFEHSPHNGIQMDNSHISSWLPYDKT